MIAPKHRQRIPLLLASAVVGALLASPAPARADNIDESLLKEATKVMRTLKARQYKNVGVLKFRVKKGERPASLAAGLLNANMATRLEYALILVNSEADPVGITRDASQVAAANKLTLEDKKGLFGLDYPLAWGKQKVAVDAFLTGEVSIDRDFKKTTVSIEAFDRKDGKEEVAKFTVDTDRSILSDAGESFSLVKRGNDEDEAAIEDVAQRVNDNKLTNPDTVENFIDLEIYYDGQKQPIATQPNGAKTVAEPKTGTKVYFKVRNKAKEQLALVLRVNGVNTLHKEGPERQIDRCTKWVLEPGKEYTIQGFYLRDNKIEEFKVVSPAGLTSLDPLKMGMIEAAVFRQAGEEDPLSTRRLTNLRGLDPAKPRPATLKEMKAELFASYQAPAQFKGVIVEGEVKQGGTIKTINWEKPTYAGSMTIRYFP